MDKKNSFILYNDYHRHINRLSDEDAGRLFKAIFVYSMTGEVPPLSDIADMAFSFIQAQLDRDREKFAEVCRRRSENVRKRWEREKSAADKACADDANDTNVYKPIQNDSTCTDNDNETENENENVNENGNGNDNENDTVSHTPSLPDSKQAAKKLLEAYRQLCPEFTGVSSLTRKRICSVELLLNRYGADTIRSVLKKAHSSSFLRGKNPRGWTATFDWIINEENFLKVRDGNYDDREPVRSVSDKDGGDDFDIEKYKQFINRF